MKQITSIRPDFSSPVLDCGWWNGVTSWTESKKRRELFGCMQLVSIEWTINDELLNYWCSWSGKYNLVVNRMFRTSFSPEHMIIPTKSRLIFHSLIVTQILHLRCQPIVLELDMGGSFTVLYFYFDFRNTEQQHTAGMLCSLLYQLANQLWAVPEEICLLWEKYKAKKSRPSPKEPLELYISVVQLYFTKVFIALDALGECSETVFHYLFSSN